MADMDLINIPFSAKGPSFGHRVCYFFNAAVVSALPIYLFIFVHGMDPEPYLAMFAGVTLLSAVILSFAYHHTASSLRETIIYKREDAAKSSKNKSHKTDLAATISAASYESISFTIFYNNSFFLLLHILCSFYLFRNSPPALNYIMSMLISACISAIASAPFK